MLNGQRLHDLLENVTGATVPAVEPEGNLQVLLEWMMMHDLDVKQDDQFIVYN